MVDVEVFVDATYGYEVKGEMVCEAGAVMLARGPAITTREAGHGITIVEPDWRARFKTAYREQIAGWVTRSEAESRGDRAPRTDMPPRSRRPLASKLAFPDPDQGYACRCSRLLQVTATRRQDAPVRAAIVPGIRYAGPAVKARLAVTSRPRAPTRT